MSRRLAPTVVLLAAVATLAASGVTSDPADLIVHEWGTFTSIAGADGHAVEWAPQAGPSDLPCFVERSRFNIKGSLWGTVRMETPVLYFYTPRAMQARVGVQFRQGLITEWFPPAVVTPGSAIGSKWEGNIRWNSVSVEPGLAPDFRVEPGASHYYLARQTDASPVVSGSETERFLFYRGVGKFAPPIAATIAADGSVTVSRPDGAALGDIIVFRNQAGMTGYDVHHLATNRATVGLPAVADEFPSPQQDLQTILEAHGLFPREAQAMVETWSDSWFDEGVRVLYLVPSAAIDSILPLDIDPLPKQVARVFVGRLELVTPDILRAVRDSLATGDRATLAKYGRFLQPIGARLLASTDPSARRLVEAQIQSIASSLATPDTRCH